MDNFISLFEDRIKEEYVKQWQAEIGESSKLTVYRSFKTNFLCESYLFDIELSHLSRILTQFRISNHNFEVEIGRRDSVLLEDRICKICNKNGDIVLEDELHFLLLCPAYENIHRKFSICDDVVCRNFDLFVSIMSNNNPTSQLHLAKYLNKAFHRRNIILKIK